MGFFNDMCRIGLHRWMSPRQWIPWQIRSYLVLAFTIKSKFIGWFAIRHLVYFEPMSGGMDQTRHMLLHIFNICCIESRARYTHVHYASNMPPPLFTIQLVGKRITWINDQDFPIGFSFIQQRHDTQCFHLLDLAWCTNAWTNFTHINRIIVATCLRIWMCSCGIFPSLKISVNDGLNWLNRSIAYLWQATIVPDIALVRKTIAYKAKFALFHILLQRIESLSSSYL